MGDRRDEARVESAREQNSIRHLSHHPLSHSPLEAGSQGLEIKRVAWSVAGLHKPLGGEVASELVGVGVIDVTWREGDDVVADWVQTLELRGEIYGAGLGAAAAHVESGDADGVSGSDDSVLDLVVEDPREHAVQVLGSVNSILLVLNVLVSSGSFGSSLVSMSAIPEE